MEVAYLEHQLLTSLLGQRRGPALSVKACGVTGRAGRRTRGTQLIEN